jgi:hypothetical protein
MAPLEENMKIHYFNDKISDSSFASIKCTIMVDHQKFQENDAVMQFYVNFQRLQKSEVLTYQACNVSAIQDSGGGRQGPRGHGGGGRGGPNACALGLIPQEDSEKVTTVENKYYPTSVYNKFILAKKAKHFLLRNPRKIPWTGPSGRKTNKGSAGVAELTSAFTAVSVAAVAISELTAATTKRTAADEGGTNYNDQNKNNN